MLTLGVLGPLRAADEHGPVPLKGPRHRAVLARLLVARGRVVPVTQLIDDLWERPPGDATGAIQTFVSALRRALEPGRAARQPARVLVTVPPGYAVRLDADQVDASRFERLLSEGGEHLAAGRHPAALDVLGTALDLWQGPAYAEFADQGWARGEIARLDELRLLAVEQRAEALVRLGRNSAAIAALEPHLLDHPLREQAWWTMALAMYRSGRQVDALAAVRSVRTRLRDELGMYPGARLRDLESAMLAQSPELLRPSDTGQQPEGAARPALPGSGQPHDDAIDPSSVDLSPTPNPSAGRNPHGGELFVGRAEVLARLRGVAEEVAQQVHSRLVLISGGEGIGKSALALALSDLLAKDGWACGWGPSPAVPGTPPNWPWSRIVAGLNASGPRPEGPMSPRAGREALASGGEGTALAESYWGPAVVDDRAVVLDGLPVDAGDPAVARFLTQRAAVDQLSAVAAHGPVVVVFDDLQWAGEETLELLTILVGAAGPVLLVGTYRSTEVGADMTAALGRLARSEPERVSLGGLLIEETAELVRAVVGHDVDAEVITRIQRRGNGNPFFTRELARLLRDTGETALEAVPAGVRDVLRYRLAGLAASDRTVLELASIIGDVVERDLLVELAVRVAAPRHEGDAEESVIAGLDAAVHAGFLDESDSARMFFAHGLVRDVVYGDISAAHRSRWHAAAGELLERIGGVDAARLAHHFGRAGTRATAARSAKYARAAAISAESAFAPHEAARWWEQAVTAYERIGATRERATGAGDGDMSGARDRLEAVMGSVRALAITGRLALARQRRMEALAAATELGDPELVARVVVAFDVPAVWTDNDDPAAALELVAAAEYALGELPAADTELRCRLLAAIALELRNTDTPRGRAAAAAAEAIARETDSPALLALALNARFMQSFHRAGLAPERARLGIELVTLARAHGLVTFEVLGHLILIQARGALADFEAADAHAAAVDALAERYGLPLAGFFTGWYSALRQSISSPYAESEAAYRAAAAAAPGTAMPGLEQGLLPMALLCLRLRHDMPIEVDPGTEWGAHEPWVRPLLLAAAHRPQQARAAVRALPVPPRDLLLELRLCLLAGVAVALDEQALIRELHARLLPAAAELAGAGTGLLTLEPVAHYLRMLERASAEPLPR
ncbi:BTAD domain-containing putative transcriptional regulator [Nocardia sp. NPDC058058]|uniref:BTAD domain-containing putative transcriptional regulator n=1 Tax=Nocardia sp. NPDC058058 TaxID=3346317 RepID=UPI0036DDC6E5